VGFAAETDHLAQHARAKLEGKGLDLIAANPVGPAADGVGFDREENTLGPFWRDGDRSLERAPKTTIARQLVQQITELYSKKGGYTGNE